MADIPINITCRNGKLHADPKRVPFGKHTIVWTPRHGAQVTGITFDASDAPFSDPQERSNGTWTSQDDNQNTGDEPETWTYTIHGSCSAAEQPAAFDPEIINDPEGGKDEDKGKGKGKGENGDRGR